VIFHRKQQTAAERNSANPRTAHKYVFLVPKFSPDPFIIIHNSNTRDMRPLRVSLLSGISSFLLAPAKCAILAFR